MAVVLVEAVILEEEVVAMVEATHLIRQTQTQPPANQNPPNVTQILNIKVDFKDKDRFAGQDYHVWAMRLQAIFEEQEVWDVVNGNM